MTDQAMQVEMFVSIRNLKSIAEEEKFDAYCLVYENRKNEWVKIGQTEIYSDEGAKINYDYETSITLDYYRNTDTEKKQKLIFMVMDQDDIDENTCELIGETQVTLDELMEASQHIYTCTLTNKG